ncbi:MAG TPA: Ig-like domain-containing protein, partial [Blastocatellia bacterium]|nr:Ig-like domain-containing protein [Blastocatellia bacterium]
QAGEVSSINPAISMTPGTHTVIVRAWDSTGAFGDQTLTLTVVAGVSVTVPSPANNASVSSPVAISASASSGHAITGWHIYVDSNEVYTGGPVTSIDPGIDMSTGAHTVIVRAWDSTGAFGDQTLTLNVGSSSGVVVSVTSPGDEITTSSPVAFNATAGSNNPITGWHIYVDGNDSFSGEAQDSITPTLSMSTGTHTIVVRAWDGTGAFGDRTLTVTIE